MSTYKELNTGKKQEEDDFKIVIEDVEDVADTDNDNEDNTQVDIVDDKSDTTVDTKEDKQDEQDKKRQFNKPSRSEKRIKQLHGDLQREKMEKQAILDELENLKKHSSETSKISKEQMKTTLESKVDSLNSRLIKAMEEGDTETTVKVQSDLIKTNNELYDLTKELSSYKPYEVKKQENQDNTPKISDKALNWIEEHPEFKEDPIFNGAALAVNSTLINSGWDPDTEEFYEEINARLSKRFPEIFGVSDKNDVKSEDKDKNTSKKDSDGTKNKSQRYAEQTVSGASRTPNIDSDGKSSNSKKNTITLTAEDIRLAKKWDMTPEQFAKRKLALQNKQRGDYVEINVG